MDFFALRGAFTRGVGALPLVGETLRAMHVARAEDLLGLFAGFLRPGESVLDIGCGSGALVDVLRRRGWDATGTDVADQTLFGGPDMPLIVGGRIPFPEGRFDVALMVAVLHHVPAREHERLFDEAARVARRVIVLEDIFESRLDFWLTTAADSLLNFEFIGHPRANRTDAGWRAFFAARGFEVTGEGRGRSWVFFDVKAYHLARRAAG